MKRPDGYHPQFDIDLAYGHTGEELLESTLLGVAGHSTIEVKTESYRHDRYYIETQHDPGRTGTYKPSGLKTTTADWWAFNTDGCHIQLSRTETVIDALTRRKEAPPGQVAENECSRGDNPTKGYLVAGEWLRTCSYRSPMT